MSPPTRRWAAMRTQVKREHRDSGEAERRSSGEAERGRRGSDEAERGRGRGGTGARTKRSGGTRTRTGGAQGRKDSSETEHGDGSRSSSRVPIKRDRVSSGPVRPDAIACRAAPLARMPSRVKRPVRPDAPLLQESHVCAITLTRLSCKAGRTNVRFLQNRISVVTQTRLSCKNRQDSRPGRTPDHSRMAAPCRTGTMRHASCRERGWLFRDTKKAPSRSNSGPSLIGRSGQPPQLETPPATHGAAAASATTPAFSPAAR